MKPSDGRIAIFICGPVRYAVYVCRMIDRIFQGYSYDCFYHLWKKDLGNKVRTSEVYDLKEIENNPRTKVLICQEPYCVDDFAEYIGPQSGSKSSVNATMGMFFSVNLLCHYLEQLPDFSKYRYILRLRTDCVIIHPDFPSLLDGAENTLTVGKNYYITDETLCDHICFGRLNSFFSLWRFKSMNEIYKYYLKANRYPELMLGQRLRENPDIHINDKLIRFCDYHIIYFPPSENDPAAIANFLNTHGVEALYGNGRQMLDFEQIKSFVENLKLKRQKQKQQKEKSLQLPPKMRQFSIVCHNYNKGAYIGEAIESVLNQTCKEWELIIVDDASTDNSVEVIQRYLHDPRIKLIRHKTNQGIARAVMDGIAHVRTEIYGELDSDDALTPNAIEVMIKAHREHPECGFIYSQNIYCDEQLNPVKIGFCKALPKGKTTLQADVVSAFRTYKLKEYLRTPGHDPLLECAVDKDMIHKIEEVTQLHFVPQPLYLIRHVPQSASRGKEQPLLSYLCWAKSKINAYQRRSRKVAVQQKLDPDTVFAQSITEAIKTDLHIQLFFEMVIRYEAILSCELPVPWALKNAQKERLVFWIATQADIKGILAAFRKHGILEDSSWVEVFNARKKQRQHLEKMQAKAESETTTSPNKTMSSETKEDELKSAIQLFQKAQQAFAAGNMLTARRLMAHYQAAMHYDHLPRIDRRDPSATPLMSVIIVTYQRSADVAKLLDCFQHQTDSDFETILVDNGGTDIAAMTDKADCIIPCPINFNLSEGRNIGAWFARGRIAVFVDDDALVDANYLASVRRAFETYRVLGLRGRTLPKTPVPNQHISICDRGDKPFPTLCNQEGNSAFLLSAWRAVGGQDPLLFGHEGTDLTWRLIHAFGRQDVVMYWPDTVIYHDYGDGGKTRRKRRQQDINQDYLLYKYDQSIADIRLHLETLPLAEGNALSMQPQAVADAHRWYGLCYQDNLHKLDTVPSPKVAVVIACQNMAEYLPQCLDGICAQTLQEWEALIVDDGSTDGSREILQQYAQRDKRFRLFFFDKSEGPYVRRNFAIQHARAPFISIQDADDILAPHKLEMLLEEILRDDSLGVVGSFFGRFIDTFRGPEYCDRIRLKVSHDEIVKGYHRSFYVCWHASAIIRKTLFEQVGLYDCQPWGSDTFWLAKAALYGILTGTVRFKNLPEILTYKREHKKSQTGTILLNHPNGRRKVLSRYGQQKLMEIAQKARENPGFDVGQAIRNCNCDDFIPRFGHLFEQWESGAVSRQLIADLLSKAIHEFVSGYCSDCLISLNSLCDVCNGVEKEIQGLNLLRGLCQYIAAEEQSARWSLEQEYADHGTVQAREFINRFLTQANDGPGGPQRREIVDRFIFMDTPKSPVEAEVIYDNRTPVTPQVSVILDCRRGTVDLQTILAEWMAQTRQRFELLILTTGNSAADFAGQTLPLPTAVLNFAEGISSAAVKNQAAAVARGDILVFAAWHIAVRPDCVAVVQEALKTPAIGAVSGRIILPAGSWNTNLDYGDKKIFCCLDQDLLCAVKRDVFTRAGGLDEGLWGRDMLSLSWTIYSGLDTEWGSILYVPDLAGTWRPDVPVTTNYILRQLAADQLFWRRSCPEKYWDFVVFAERCFWVNEVSGQGDPGQAGLVVQLFAGRHRAIALQWARLAYRLRSDRLAELYALANCEWDAGNRDEAARYYEQVLAIPSMQKIETEIFAPEERTKVSEVFRCYVATTLKLAEYYRDRGHSQKSRQMLERLKANPNNVLDQQQQVQWDVLYQSVQARQEKHVSVLTEAPTQRPRVSVIMPAYNSAAYIDAAIQSVLAQTYTDFELIIVNDGSTDHTEQVIRNYKDSRIRYFSQANAGLAATRNTAVRQATGQFIVPLDDDDRMTPEFIAQHVAAFERHPEADLIYCDDHLVNEAGRSLRVIRRKEVHDQTQLISGLFQGGFPFIPFRTCIRRSVFDKIGLYDETLRVAEDYDMMRRFAAHGLIARHLAGDFYIRCVRTDSLSRNHTRSKAEMHFGVIRRFIDTFAWEQLFPDASWEGLDSVHRAFQGHYLSAHVFQAIERNYIQNRTPGFYAEVAIDFAIEQLEHCLELSPDNPEILQKIEECRQRKSQEMAAVGE